MQKFIIFRLHGIIVTPLFIIIEKENKFIHFLIHIGFERGKRFKEKYFSNEIEICQGHSIILIKIDSKWVFQKQKFFVDILIRSIVLNSKIEIKNYFK